MTGSNTVPYVVYEAATGKIIKTGTAPKTQIAQQATHAGQVALRLPEDKLRQVDGVMARIERQLRADPATGEIVTVDAEGPT